MNKIEKIQDTLRHIEMGSNLKEVKPYNYAIISAIVNKSGKPASKWHADEMAYAVEKYREEHSTCPKIFYTIEGCISFLKSKGYKIYKLQEVPV
jgi:hypothetical protein